MFPTLGLLAVLVPLSAVPEEELTLQQVLKANTAAVQAIHSIHVTIHQANNAQVPGEDKPPTEALPTYIIEWFKDGNRERVRQNLLRGRRPHNYDAYNGPDGWKRLENYDPDFTPPLSESISSPGMGEIDKRHTDDVLSGAVRGAAFIGPVGDTVEEYMMKHPSSKMVATPATSKLGCYEITRLEEKRAVAGSKYDVREVRYYVDPKASFWLRRVDRGPWQKSADPGDKGSTILEVQEFKNCGNGLFWPMRAYIRTRLPGATVGPDYYIRHTLHSINQPLPNENFEIHFPDWLRVYDRISGKVFIWGPDDKPRMEFASAPEYNDWYKLRAQDPFHPMEGLPPRMRWAWLTGISVFVGLILVLILWRRSKTSRRLQSVPDSPEITPPPSETEGKVTP